MVPQLRFPYLSHGANYSPYLTDCSLMYSFSEFQWNLMTKLQAEVTNTQHSSWVSRTVFTIFHCSRIKKKSYSEVIH